MTFDFHVNPGDFLYVLAHDTGQPHSWQGTFSTPVGTINTNATDWVGANVGSTGADWIWTSGPNSGDVTALFRTAAPVSAMPVPAAFALMAPALGLLGAARRRRAG